MSKQKIIVTGGFGFIGSNFIKMLSHNKYEIFVIDSLTYAADLDNLDLDKVSKHFNVNVCNEKALVDIFSEILPDKVIHFAAESHVDRSISAPDTFIETNILGTYSLLKASLNYYDENKKRNFLFIHISTDEVFGSLELGENSFNENTPYKPNSPYSASKASSDHLVRSFNETYKLPSTLLNCSNNFGPNQYEEKLIPLVINKALNGLNIPIYGDGEQIRDWIFVEDFCEAILMVLEKNIINEKFNIGANNEIRNLDLVRKICFILDEIEPLDAGKKYSNLMQFVEDRRGHDFRYSINSEKIRENLDWKPNWDFDDALNFTVKHYLDKFKKQK
tara:strand:- start:2030 stop:3028 length:999 start_codon:yes stop_codon:yes gene_type:complete